MKTKLLTLMGLLLIASPSWAAEFCVQSSSDLTAALSSAGSNGQTDLIKIKQGLYTVPSGGFSLNNSDNMDVTISGDWTEFFDNPCGQQLNGNAFNTVLDGDGVERIINFFMNFSGDLIISNLFFANAHYTTTNGGGRGGAIGFFPAPNYGGEILIENNAFINNTADYGAAISLIAGRLVTLKNNLFTINKTNQCCAVEVLVSDQADGIYIINNTFYQNYHVGNDAGYISGLWLSASSTAQAFVANNIFWENDFVDISFNGDGFKYFKNNNIEELEGTVNLFDSNISADPNFEVGIFNYTPAAGSLMINAGLDSPPFPLPIFDQNWDVGSSDLIGDTRVKMGAVDIGAVESAQMDVIFASGFEIIL